MSDAAVFNVIEFCRRSRPTDSRFLTVERGMRELNRAITRRANGDSGLNQKPTFLSRSKGVPLVIALNRRATNGATFIRLSGKRERAQSEKSNQPAPTMIAKMSHPTT
jgi:hypothetical protein